MPLDRVVTLQLEAPGKQQGQRYVPGPTTDYPGIWAEVRDGGISETVVSGGFRVFQRKIFVVRWRRDLLLTPPSRVHIVDEYNRTFDIETVVEDSGSRRRFIEVTGTAEVTPDA